MPNAQKGDNAMRRIARDERGSVVLVFAAFWLPLLLVASAVAANFGAQRLMRERLQTAADAASLAAIMSADGYADISVAACRHIKRTCRDTWGNTYDCSRYVAAGSAGFRFRQLLLNTGSLRKPQKLRFCGRDMQQSLPPRLCNGTGHTVARRKALRRNGLLGIA